MVVPVAERRVTGEPRSKRVLERSAAKFLHSEPERRSALAAALGLPEGDVGEVAVEEWSGRLRRTTVFLGATLSGQPVRLVAKLDPDGGGERAFRGMGSLRAAGLAPPTPATVPGALGYDPERRLLVLERAPGRTWLEEVLAGRGAVASERAADWLLALQALELPLLPVRRAATAPAVFCRDLSDLLPELAPDLRRWPRRLAALQDDGAVSGWSPAHGDFHPKNVLVAPGRTTAVDLDEVGFGDPAADVGTAVAQLLALSFFETGSPTRGAEPAAVFWERWARRAPGGRLEERAALHALASLLGVLHYSYALNTQHRELAHRWLPGLEAWWRARRWGFLAGLARCAEAA